MRGRFEVTDEVCKCLGKTPEQIQKMTLSRFSDLVFEKGYIVRVGEPELTDKGDGGLTIEMRHNPQAGTM